MCYVTSDKGLTPVVNM